MKQLFPLLFFLVFISCTRSYKTVLDSAESLMNSNPDSSLVLLEKLESQITSKSTLRPRYVLLHTMAKDKCYMDMASDTLIRDSYAWYQKHGSESERMLAAYYLGVVEQSIGNNLEAALAFMEAEPLAQSLGNSRQLSLIEQHLSSIFAENYNHARALEYAVKSLDSAKASGDSLMVDYCKLDIVYQLLAEFRYAEAGSLLDELLRGKSISPEFYVCVCGLKARVLLFSEAHDANGARMIYESIPVGDSVYYSLTDYGRLAFLEEVEGRVEKADDYLEREFSFVHDRIDSLNYFNDCYNVYDRRGDWKNAASFLSKRTQLQDEIVEELLAQSETRALEGFYHERLTYEQLRAQSRRYAIMAMAVSFLVVVFALLLLLVRMQRKLMDDMVKIREISDDISTLRLHNSVTYGLVDSLIVDKINSLQQLSESFFSWEDSEVKKREVNKGMLLKDDVIRLFRSQLGELRKDKSFVEVLEQSLNLTEDGLMQKARKLLKREKELDFTILTLLFSGFSIKSISYLLKMSESSLRMRKTRYKQHFEQIPASQGDIFIAKLG